MEYKPLNKKLILEGLKDTIFKDAIILEEIDSTNEFAKRISKKDNVLIVAEHQTAGKGRRGRRWFSKKYANLLFSLLLKPDLTKEYTFSLSMALALSSVFSIEKIAEVKALIKWPNDIYVNQKKIAGILTEFSLKGEKLDYVIIGMGINVNWAPKAEELLYPATSLKDETGRTFEREILLLDILKRFSDYYKKILSGDIDELYRSWNEHSLIIGKTVSAEDGTKGKALRIEKDGSLIILADGKEKRITYGDINL